MYAVVGNSHVVIGDKVPWQIMIGDKHRQFVLDNKMKIVWVEGTEMERKEEKLVLVDVDEFFKDPLFMD